MATFEIGEIVDNPGWDYTGSTINGQGFKPDGWVGTRSTADLQQDGVWETNTDVGRSGLWFDDTLDSVEGVGNTYMAFGGRTREAIGTDTTQDLSAGDEIVIDFSYVVSNTTATSFEGDASGTFRFQIGTDFVDVPLQMPATPTEPWWQEASVTLTLTQDVPAGTQFNMQAISGGYIGIDALGGAPDGIVDGEETGEVMMTAARRQTAAVIRSPMAMTASKAMAATTALLLAAATTLSMAVRTMTQSLAV
ncbi:hypothetical protein [uncultured Tateyamaria sp.]|uniref:hypothetical protein n=1 Tax=uncultured Tateyamaria sp. TaxID=455651 RepID=UPI0026159272|nr:hypothetical protein [uncultured Tateyamaria sp.]